MRPSTKLFSIILVLVLILLPTGTAAAAGLADGKVVFASSYTLHSGNTLTGDLVIFGGTGTVEAGATVTGSTVLMGGSLVINGEVAQDIVLIGGALTLGEKSVVHGNVTTVGASLYRAEGSVVDGEIFNSATTYNPGTDSQPDETPSPVPNIPPVTVDTNPFTRAMNLLFRALMFGLLAGLLAVFLPEQLGRVSQAVLSQPVVTGGMGLLTVVVVPLGMVVMAITLILIPVSALVLLVWLLAMLFGWIALGTEFGLRLVRSSANPWPTWLAAGVGTFVLTLVANGIGEYLWCVGWMVPFLVTILGLGGIVLTRFGTQVALPPVVISQSPAAPPEMPGSENE